MPACGRGDGRRAGPGAPDPSGTAEARALVATDLGDVGRHRRRRRACPLVDGRGLGRSAPARRGRHVVSRAGGLRASPARGARAARRVVPALLPRIPGVPVQRPRRGLGDGRGTGGDSRHAVEHRRAEGRRCAGVRGAAGGDGVPRPVARARAAGGRDRRDPLAPRLEPVRTRPPGPLRRRPRLASARRAALLSRARGAAARAARHPMAVGAARGGVAGRARDHARHLGDDPGRRVPAAGLRAPARAPGTRRAHQVRLGRRVGGGAGGMVVDPRARAPRPTRRGRDVGDAPVRRPHRRDRERAGPVPSVHGVDRRRRLGLRTGARTPSPVRICGRRDTARVPRPRALGRVTLARQRVRHAARQPGARLRRTARDPAAVRGDRRRRAVRDAAAVEMALGRPGGGGSGDVGRGSRGRVAARARPEIGE